MAAFSTLALIGLAGALGAGAGKAGVLGKAKKTGLFGGQPQTIAGGPATPVQAPGPTNADGSIAAPAFPPTVLETASKGVAAGQLAAQRTKRKMQAPARGAGWLMQDGRSIAAKSEPKTLIGSGY